MKTTIIASAILCATLLASCSQAPVTTPAAKEEVKACCSKDNAPEAGEVSDESLFNITSKWTTQYGTPFVTTDLSGKVTVAAMIFTSCQSACPRIMADLKNIRAALSDANRARTHFLLITMDPANDTPERLKAFMKEHQLDSMWTLVCADDDATAEMANVLGVRIKKLSGGGFDHSNTVYVLGKDGVIAHRQDGLGQDPASTLQAIHTLLQ